MTCRRGRTCLVQSACPQGAKGWMVMWPREMPLHMVRFASLLLLSLVSRLPPGHISDQQAQAASNLMPLPVISRGVPAYTNDDCAGSYPATAANDASYDTQWRS